MIIKELFYKFNVCEVQGLHRMVTLNILGDLSGHGRNSGGEWHLWRSRRSGSTDECGIVHHRDGTCGGHQHRAAHAPRASPVRTGVCFDIIVTPIRDFIVDVKCVCATVKIKFIIGNISLCSDEFCYLRKIP